MSDPQQLLSEYHKYLNEYYEGGCERFFSPTGFLEKFQREVEVDVADTRNHMFVKSCDEAEKLLQPVVQGSEGVFDLTAEPGTGKTSVLPFRFPSKRVIVALPTPFDAWSAFQMATGEAQLHIKGLRLGPKTAKVTYTDSYLAARALLSNYLDYDVLIVDECDSPRGVTKFLAEVRTKGKVVIRMSASHGVAKGGPSKAFRVTESDNLPSVRDGILPMVEFVKSHHSGRSLVLVPDAETAIHVGLQIPEASVICTKSNLKDIAGAVLNQAAEKLYVADDTCARGLNLNLDVVFDCQLVAEYGTDRVITAAELYQRKGRVGRNKPGWYYSPGLKPVEKADSDMDVARHNLARAVGSVRQVGDGRLRFDQKDVEALMTTPIEPYAALAHRRASERAIANSSSSSASRHSSGGSAYHSSSSRRSSDTRSEAMVPPWLFHYSGSANRSGKGVIPVSQDKFIVKSKGNLVAVRRRSSSSDDNEADADRSMKSYRHRRSHLSSPRALLPVAEGAPYAVTQYREEPVKPKLQLPMSPPIMDLTQLTYDLDWPALIRDRLSTGGDLPTLVPPANWRHTSVGGMGSDWFRRLDDVATSDTKFDDRELEIVCRAWNKLVAQSWVRRTPGLSDVSNYDRIEFCVRYFQSYFLLSSAE